MARSSTDKHRAWREKNREKFNAYQREYHRQRRARDEEFRAKQNANSTHRARLHERRADGGARTQTAEANPEKARGPISRPRVRRATRC